MSDAEPWREAWVKICPKAGSYTDAEIFRAGFLAATAQPGRDPSNPFQDRGGVQRSLAPHQERLELAAKTLEAYTGDPRNNRARDVREAAKELARLSAATAHLSAERDDPLRPTDMDPRRIYPMSDWPEVEARLRADIAETAPDHTKWTYVLVKKADLLAALARIEALTPPAADPSTQALIETASLLASSMEAVDAALSKTYALEPGHTTDGIAATMIRRLLAELARLSTSQGSAK